MHFLIEQSIQSYLHLSTKKMGFKKKKKKTLYVCCQASHNLVADKEGGVGAGWTRHSHVRTVGMRAANMRKSMEKKRKPELLRTFLASFPIPR